MKQTHKFIYKDGPMSARWESRADWKQYHDQSIKNIAQNSIENATQNDIERREQQTIKTHTETRNDLTDIDLKNAAEETIDKHIDNLERYFTTLSQKIEQRIRFHSKGLFDAQDIMKDLGNPEYKSVVEAVLKDIEGPKLKKAMSSFQNPAVIKEIQSKAPTWDANTMMGIAFASVTTFVYARSVEGWENENKWNMGLAGAIPFFLTNGFGYGPKINNKPIVQNILESAGGFAYEFTVWNARFGFDIMNMMKGKGESFGQNMKDNLQKFMNAATGPWGKTWELSPEKYGESPEEIFWKKAEIFAESGPTQTRDFFAFVIKYKHKKAAELTFEEQQELHKATKGAVQFMLEMEVNQPQVNIENNDPAYREKDALNQVRDLIGAAIESDPNLFIASYKELLSQKLSNPSMEGLKWETNIQDKFKEQCGEEIATNILKTYDEDIGKYSRKKEVIKLPNGQPLGGFNGVELAAGTAIGFRFLAGLASFVVQNIQGEGFVGKINEKRKQKKEERERKRKELPSNQKWEKSKTFKKTLKNGIKQENKKKPQKEKIHTLFDEFQKSGIINATQRDELKKSFSDDARCINFWEKINQQPNPDEPQTYAQLLLTQETKKSGATQLFQFLNDTKLTSQKREIEDIKEANNLFWGLQDKTKQIRNALREKNNKNIKNITFTLKDDYNGASEITIDKIIPKKPSKNGNIKITGEINGKNRVIILKTENGNSYIQFKDASRKKTPWLQITQINGI